MPVVVVLVLRLVGDAYEEEYDDVRDEVRQRMDGIGEHGGTAPEDARGKLEEEEGEVDHAADDGHAVDAPFVFRPSRCVPVFHNT